MSSDEGLTTSGGAGFAGDPLRAALVGLVVLTVGFAIASWLIEGITISWVVYPTALVVGALRLRKGGTRGRVFITVAALIFLLVHVPFVAAAFSDNCKNPLTDEACHEGFWIVSLGILPLVTLATGLAAWRRAGGG